jgi:hypothetical protein
MTAIDRKGAGTWGVAATSGTAWIERHRAALLVPS